jgi:putative transposase
VKVEQRWHYICIIIDLYNREIIGHSAGPHKNAALVQRTFASDSYNLHRLEMTHTDRCSEFKNQLIDKKFSISSNHSVKKEHPMSMPLGKLHVRSLKQSLYFTNQEELDFDHFNYVHSFNRIRIYESLNYQTPNEYK